MITHADVRTNNTVANGASVGAGTGTIAAGLAVVQYVLPYELAGRRTYQYSIAPGGTAGRHVRDRLERVLLVRVGRWERDGKLVQDAAKRFQLAVELTQLQKVALLINRKKRP